MIKAIIVEDMEYIRKGLISLLEQIEEDSINVIGECASIKEALVLVEACKPDLIFLDINLSDGNAFDFLEQTKECDFKIIFITAYEEYALEAFKQNAIDYLLKPIQADELQKAVEKVLAVTSNSKVAETSNKLRNHEEGNSKIILRLSDGYQVVMLSQLLYCKSSGGYTTFFLENGKFYLSSGSLKNFEKRLNAANFFRVHKSFFVNMNFIDKYDRKGYVVLKGGVDVPVSNRKRDAFLKCFLGQEIDSDKDSFE
jgi:two-component system LytT family response regulator